VFPQQILRQAFFGLSYVLFIPFLGKIIQDTKMLTLSCS
jgi:hypothetical protein